MFLIPTNQHRHTFNQKSKSTPTSINKNKNHTDSTQLSRRTIVTTWQRQFYHSTKQSFRINIWFSFLLINTDTLSINSQKHCPDTLPSTKRSKESTSINKNKNHTHKQSTQSSRRTIITTWQRQFYHSTKQSRFVFNICFSFLLINTDTLFNQKAKSTAKNQYSNQLTRLNHILSIIVGVYN